MIRHLTVDLLWSDTGGTSPHYRLVTDFGLAFDYFPSKGNGRLLSPCCTYRLMVLNDERTDGTPEYATCISCRQYTAVRNDLHTLCYDGMAEATLEQVASCFLDPLESVLLASVLRQTLDELSAVSLSALPRKESFLTRWRHRRTFKALRPFRQRVLA